jgi:hypothetical protein
MISFLTAADAMHHLHARHLLFSQSNLVSDDQPGHLNAQIQDTNLINPWGVAFSPNGPFWVNNNHTGTSTLYSVDPATDTTTAAPLVVTIAPPAGGTGPNAQLASCSTTTRAGSRERTPACLFLPPRTERSRPGQVARTLFGRNRH